ncbi:MAG: biotin/lipoyl-binding protein [Chloroflexi bacterium]|nr:biotin/lipoyl-binding protein [Chloroflexota bacterium]
MTDRTLRLVAIGVDDDIVLELEPSEASPDIAGLVPRRLMPTAADVATGRARYEVTVDGWVIVVTVESAARATLRERATRLAGATGHATPQTVKAKIPGRVARVWVTPGTDVQQGDRLLSIEAMKMENEIRAPRAGTVLSVSVEVGDRVELGSVLAVVG